MMPPTRPSDAIHALQVALQVMIVRHGVLTGGVQEEGLAIVIPHAEVARLYDSKGCTFRFQSDQFGNITASVTGYAGERGPRLHPADRDNPPPAAEA